MFGLNWFMVRASQKSRSVHSFLSIVLPTFLSIFLNSSRKYERIRVDHPETLPFTVMKTSCMTRTCVRAHSSWNIFREYFSCCFTSQHLFPFINVLILARMTRIFTSKCHEISRVRSFIAEVNKWVYAWNFCVGGQSQRNECLWLVNSNRHNSGCPKNTCIKNKTHNTQQDARKQNRWASTKKNSNTQRAVYKTLEFDACVLLTEWIWLLWQR